MNETALLRAYGLDPASVEATAEPPVVADAADGGLVSGPPTASDDSEYDHWVDQQITDRPMP